MSDQTPPPNESVPRRVRPNLSLGLMLLALHAALVLGLGTGASRALLLAHFGLFLLWQPVWQGTRRLVPSRALMVVAGGAALAWWGTWPLLGLWLALLFALIGGNVPGMRALHPRIAPLLAAVYLLAVLLTWVVPNIFGGVEADSLLANAVRFGLPAPLLVILALTENPRDDSVRSMDLVSTLLLFLMVVVLTLGALFVQQATRSDYPTALAQTVVGIGAVLFIISWLWDPRGGFAGIGQMLTRYFLSMGLPFERWMHSLADLAAREPDPQRFVALAAERMRELPWLSAVSWESTGGHAGRVGDTTPHATDFVFRGLRLRLHTQWRPGPALLLHMHLLARLLGDYHDMKVQAQAQRHLAYLQAIYETGSRVTHDVKNLLQSLRSLCAAAETSADDDAEALRGLIRRQLPQIAQRLQNTLDKLDTRAHTAVTDTSAAEWWRGLTQRFAHEAVAFTADGLDAGVRLPADLFDSVAENLLQNALEKCRQGAARVVTLHLACADGRCRMTVRDDGVAIPVSIARQLFTAPVASENGLGVGLYQAARQAATAAYALALAANVDGDVVFELAPVGSA